MYALYPAIITNACIGHAMTMHETATFAHQHAEHGIAQSLNIVDQTICGYAYSIARLIVELAQGPGQLVVACHQEGGATDHKVQQRAGDRPVVMPSLETAVPGKDYLCTANIYLVYYLPVLMALFSPNAINASFSQTCRSQVPGTRSHRNTHGHCSVENDFWNMVRHERHTTSNCFFSNY